MPQFEQQPIGPAALDWAIAGLCRVHRMPFRPGLFAREYPPPHSLATLARVADALGFDARVERIEPRALADRSLPVVAVLAPASGSAGPLLALVLAATAEYVVYAEQGSTDPVEMPAAALHARMTGEIVVFAPRAEQIVADDPAAEVAPGGSARPFGFRWFVPELLRHRRIWRDVLLASLAIQLMALAVPICVQIVIDKVIVHQTINTLYVVAAALFVFVLFTAGMSWVRQYLVLHTGNRIDAVLGERVFGHLFRLPPRYFDVRPTGTLVARVQGVETIRNFLSGAAMTLLLDLPFMLIFVAIMLHYSALLTAIALGVLVLIVLLSLAITPLLRERINRQFLLGARNQAFLTEYVAGMETVKSLQMEPLLRERYGDYLATYLDAGFRTGQVSNTYGTVAAALEQLLTLLILCFGAWLVMTTQDFTIGMLVAFQMFATRLSGPMLRMVGLWQQFQEADIAVRRLGDIMNAPPEPHALAPSRAGGAGGRIEVRGLGFRYGDDRPWLYRGLDLALAPGECLALTGASGSGKSTLARLLQGFYLPVEGSILVDGQDTRHLAANELRATFGVVPQETILFSGTVYDNLLLANPAADFEQVVAACRLAEIHTAIEALSQGYRTLLGEHGAGLSGGQKQRIAIARALLKRPAILIFDEATSHLDQPTAEAFAATINRLKGRVGILFIAHHLPTALQVDRTVRIGDGETAA